ncbi:MAG: Plasma membrane t-SNARE, secretory vesicle fusion [Cyphobasidiales sp. Tagirdzhanova-0007]|nr:MAG: Plasma membrane t-SNARE, secretory vesicle fusion [Cyphobasidiales sp. Tagirdzhanova-0007]
MSRDRLAQMKAERDRARGYGAGAGQQQGGAGMGAGAGGATGLSPQQQSPPSSMQQSGYGLPSEPTMYPQNGQSPPQSGRAAGQQQYQDPAYQPQGYQSQPPMTQTQGYGAAVLSPQMQPGQGGMGMQPGQGGVGDGYEMQGVAPGNGYANAEPSLGPGSSMQQFFAEIENIGQSLQVLKNNILQINTLHTTVLNSATNEARQESAQQELEALTINTSRLTNSIKLRIKNLSELNDSLPIVQGKEGENNTRRMQVAVQKKKFMDLIQEYREVEAKSREKYRGRMERQYKIVKPDATQEEIRYAMDTDQGSQVFSQALTQSTRYADARNAYREVQERHEDIKRIAQTMTELQELFNDMAMLVERQDDQIQTIEASGNDVETNMGAANVELEKGVKSARKARRKRWICFWILLLVVIALVLGLVLGILSHDNKI